MRAPDKNDTGNPSRDSSAIFDANTVATRVVNDPNVWDIYWSDQRAQNLSFGTRAHQQRLKIDFPGWRSGIQKNYFCGRKLRHRRGNGQLRGVPPLVRCIRACAQPEALVPVSKSVEMDFSYAVLLSFPFDVDRYFFLVRKTH